MSRAPSPAPVNPDPSSLPLQERLGRWAKLLAHLQNFREIITETASQDCLEAVNANNALSALEVIRVEFLEGAPGITFERSLEDNFWQ